MGRVLTVGQQVMMHCNQDCFMIGAGINHDSLQEMFRIKDRQLKFMSCNRDVELTLTSR